MKHAFISYVRENAVIVSRLAAELETANIKIWLDRKSIRSGENWKVAIYKAIQDGMCFIACFSKEYSEKPHSYMNEELNLAIDELRKRPFDKAWFFPICLTPNSIPDRQIGGGINLGDFQASDLSTGPDTEDWMFAVEKLIGDLKSHFNDVDAPEEECTIPVLEGKLPVRRSELSAGSNQREDAKLEAIVAYEKFLGILYNESRRILSTYDEEYSDLRDRGHDDNAAERIITAKSRNRIEEGMSMLTFSRLLRQSFTEISNDDWNKFFSEGKTSFKLFRASVHKAVTQNVLREELPGLTQMREDYLNRHRQRLAELLAWYQNRKS